MVKQGANIEFLATYLFNNPGAGSGQARRALCAARGIDGLARPGYYACYFYTDRYNHLWTKRDGGWYLTQRGLARVNPA